MNKAKVKHAVASLGNATKRVNLTDGPLPALNPSFIQDMVATGIRFQNP